MKRIVTVKLPFYLAYNNLRKADALILRKHLLESLELSPSNFGQKCKGDRGLTPFELKKIQSTFAKFGIDAFTGKPIQPPSPTKNEKQNTNRSKSIGRENPPTNRSRKEQPADC